MKYVSKPRKRMAAFFIEFRLHGYAKEYAKWVKSRAHSEAKRLGIKRLKEKKEVPHIALFGQAETDDIKGVISRVERIGHKYTLVPFRIHGFSRFDKKIRKVLNLDVDPSPKLKQLRWELAQSLLEISKTDKPWDKWNRGGYKFHSAIIIIENVDESKFDKLCDYVESHCGLKDYEQYRKRLKINIIDKLLVFMRKNFRKLEEEDPYISQHLLRVTILVKGRIRSEYDLVLKRLLNRKEARSKALWRVTINKFRGLQGLPQES
jgi:HD-GYP domain-containing protein (c-di-GMP phosphodiesterase class II)